MGVICKHAMGRTESGMGAWWTTLEGAGVGCHCGSTERVMALSMQQRGPSSRPQPNCAPATAVVGLRRGAPTSRTARGLSCPTPGSAVRETTCTRRAAAACPALGLRTPALVAGGPEGRGLGAGSAAPMRLLVCPLE